MKTVNRCLYLIGPLLAACFQWLYWSGPDKEISLWPSAYQMIEMLVLISFVACAVGASRNRLRQDGKVSVVFLLNAVALLGYVVLLAVSMYRYYSKEGA